MEERQTSGDRKSGKHKHLSERDRYLLEGYIESGLSVKEIAQKLNRRYNQMLWNG